VLGAATDPYQPAEGRYRLTRACIEAFRDAASPFSIITRGPLIVRDVDLLAEAAQRADVSVTFSIPTLDHEIWLRTEPGTAPPRQRLRALKQLVDAGVKASVGMAPILPGLSDKPELLANVVREARAAGATGIWSNVLHLQPGTREHFLAALAADWPELLPHYEDMYRHGSYLPRRAVDPVREQVRALAREHGVRDRRSVRLQPAKPAEQLTLAM
jgi:DNA repair photolyase